MKKITLLLSLIFAFALFFGCSTSNDGNGNTITAVIPLAPTNLTGQVISATQINLTWIDNSTNETGFKVERKTGTGAYAVVGNVNNDVLTYNDLGLIPNTTYSYRVYSFNSAGNSPTYSNIINITTNNIPTVMTSLSADPIQITTSTVTCYGSITSDGGSQIISKGFVWSSSPNPTIALTTKTNNGGGLSSFTSAITGLSSNTTYYVKAYATNSGGTAYGNEVNFTTNPIVTDFDGNIYQTIKNICGKTWISTNLSVSHYRNGDLIPQVTDATQLATITTGAWCYYGNNSSNGPIYGKLYNWYAITDPRGLAPIGYHIPSMGDWESFTACLMPAYDKNSLKETGTAHWHSPNTGATDKIGFRGLPGGCLSSGFRYMGDMAWFWTTDDGTAAGGNSSQGSFIFLDYYNSSISNYTNKHDLLSVRCVKD